MPKSEEITIFAQTNFRGQEKRFGIKQEDRRRHIYIIGKTGMGKTTLLENMIISDILSGKGCCYIDPHGDTAEKILDYIPAERINDVVYFNPADTVFPIAFNVLEAVEEKNKHLVASGLVGVFKKQFAESWGPRLEYILRNAILALLDYPGSTLLGIMRILVDKRYREKVVEKIKDPVVKSFWTNEYTKWNDRVLQEVISPIQNKVGQFLSNFLIRNIVGQVKSTIDMRKIIDSNKILILNLSKGRIGEDTMQLLGSMIVTKLYLAAMSRVDITEEARRDFYLYVDEFQNFATDSFADILSEARKYRLNLVIAHQFIEQLPENVVAAIFGNIGTLISFRVGALDAEQLVKEFTPTFTEEDLVNLPAFNIYLKLMIDQISSDPFSATTLPPLFEDRRTGSAEKTVKVSRERYARPRKTVEDKINRWSGMDLSDNVIDTTSKKRSETSPRPEKKKETKPEFNQKKFQKESQLNKMEEYRTVCAACGREAKVNFKPEPGRPVYCSECFKKVKENRRLKKTERDSKLEQLDKTQTTGFKKPRTESSLEKKVSEAPEVSLTEALKDEPVKFSKSKSEKQNKPETNRSDRQAPKSLKSE